VVTITVMFLFFTSKQKDESLKRAPASLSFMKFNIAVGRYQREKEISYAEAYDLAASEADFSDIEAMNQDPDFMMGRIYNLAQSGTKTDDSALSEIFQKGDIWRINTGSLSVGDQLIYDAGHLQNMKKFRALGYDTSRVSQAALETLKARFGDKTLRENFPELFKGGISKGPEEGRDSKSLAPGANSAVAIAYYGDILPSLLEEDLKALTALHPCLQNLGKSEADATDFCQKMYDFHKVVIPKVAGSKDPKTGLKVKQHQETPSIVGRCSIESFTSFSGEKIVNGHEVASQSVPMSTFTIRSVATEGREIIETVPMYKFYEGVKKFCGARVVEGEKRDQQSFFNAAFDEFDELYLPAGKSSGTVRESEPVFIEK